MQQLDMMDKDAMMMCIKNNASYMIQKAECRYLEYMHVINY
jgi:hypothetical protein